MRTIMAGRRESAEAEAGAIAEVRQSRSGEILLICAERRSVDSGLHSHHALLRFRRG